MSKSKIILYSLIFLLSLAITGCSGSEKQASEIKGKFVFSSNRLGRVYDVFITEHSKTRLLLERASQPVWSANGNMIACDGYNGSPKKYGFWILDSKGTKREFVETPRGLTSPFNLNWSPDNTKIYYTPVGTPGELGYENKVYYYDFISKAHTKIIELDEKFRIDNMRLSPKGDKLIIESSYKRNFCLYLSNSDGTNLKVIGLYKGNCAWYPDNEHILYIANVADDGQMYIKKDWGKAGWGYFFRMNVNTGEVEKLWLCKIFLLNLKISRDGNYFYYTAPAPGGGQAVFVSPINNPDKKIQITYPIFLTPASHGRSQDWNPDWCQD